MGAEKSKNRKQNLEKVYSFLDPFEVLNFGNKESEIYSDIRADLEKKGKPIGPNDLIIASIAISDNATLITNNQKEFQRIQRLKIENWYT